MGVRAQYEAGYCVVLYKDIIGTFPEFFTSFMKYYEEAGLSPRTAGSYPAVIECYLKRERNDCGEEFA